jgi:hypothetical protein
VTSKEIEELAGHRPVSAWIVKLVNDAIAIEREACANVCLDLTAWHSKLAIAAFESAADAIKARGNNDV